MNSTLVNALNKTLANLHVMTVKLHNYHWNVKGLQFFSIHNMTEGYYDHFFKLYDDVAERILQLEAKPLATVKEYLDNATIAEETGNSFDARQVLESILADFKTLLTDAKALGKLAEDASDSATGMLVDDIIAWLEKQIWMLRSSL